MHIDEINLVNIGCYSSISIYFNRRVNILCGSNGIGKTTILEAISLLFSGEINKKITRNANSNSPGLIGFSVNKNSTRINGQASISRYLPGEQNIVVGRNLITDASELIYIRSNRDIIYTRVDSLRRDPEKPSYILASDAADGLSNTDLKEWFARRYLFGKISNALDKYQETNVIYASDAFGLLDSSISLSRVSADTYDVFVNTPDGEIPFEYLSSGYRATLFIILGIIKELEFRRHNGPANEFSGIILIDEVDMHLHPTWQRRIMPILSSAFPKAQFIVTTHSPHVVQAAALGEVIALRRGSQGRPEIKEVPATKYGFQGWSVEEILEHVMGMPSTYSQIYDEALRNFKEALDADDREKVIDALNVLDDMIHPTSLMRKLFRLQASPYLGNDTQGTSRQGDKA